VIELDEVKQHLKVFNTHQDDIIGVYINAALSRFEQFTGRKLYADQDALDEDADAPEYTVVLNDEIKAGCLILIAHLYLNRDTDAEIPQAIAYLWQAYWVPMIS
jgi:hypothetical protein